MEHSNRRVGTTSRGIRCPIIREGDDLAAIVAESVLEAARAENFSLHDRDVIAVTESVVARAQGNYASVDEIATDVRAKLGGDTVGVLFPILSRNRFAIVLRGIATGMKKITLMLSYPSDEVGNHLFDEELLEDSGVKINCFGSAVANWSWSALKEEDFQKTTEQLRRAITRMKRLNCTMLRGMSFKAEWNRPAFDPEVEKNVFRKVNELVRMCEEAGVLYLHENCNNYGGMSWKHTLKLLDHVKSPNFKLVFDTGNPVINFDRSNGDALEHVQSSWEFYKHVKEFIYYVHIKDAKFIGRGDNGFAKAEFTFPGEGEGDVARIVEDLIRNGYDGGFSMEPHMKLVFHESTPAESAAAERYQNYVEYVRRFMKLVDDIKAKCGK